MMLSELLRVHSTLEKHNLKEKPPVKKWTGAQNS